ncbi:MAG: phosphoribosylglycinamide formyltransferase [Candidatus Omnitrophica bacterium]|nr:phosphoribosylglycinamide formyltransferase [Candidatus Omnitrophota bacterium]
MAGVSSQKRLAVFCSGSGSNFEALAKAGRRGRLGTRIVVMVCDRPDAFAVVRANRYGIPAALLEPKAFGSREAHERAIVEMLKKFRVDLVALAGYMRIVGAQILRAYPGKILNIHPSLLPSFKGAHAVRDALEYGVKITGVSVHLATEELDGGPVILQEAVRVLPADTEESLLKRIHAVEHKIYPEAVRLLARGIKVKGRVIKTK